MSGAHDGEGGRPIDVDEQALWQQLREATGSDHVWVVVGRGGRAARVAALQRAIVEAQS